MNNMFVIWNENQATGIPLIDDHHRSIASTMNSLFYFMRTKNEEMTLMPITTILEQYMKLHFFAEGKLLREANFKDADNHALQHDQILHRMKSILANSRRTGSGEELLGFLKLWWKDHLNVHEQAYSKPITDYMQSKYDS